jgi:hypothetical protein
MAFILLAGISAASAQTAVEAFQQKATVKLVAGESGVNVGIDIPVGKRLVIEQVSAYGSTASDQRISFSLMTHVAPDNTYLNYYLLSQKETSGTRNYYTVSQTVKIYADVPNFYVRVSRSAAPDTATFFYTVSGYLINQ